MDMSANKLEALREHALQYEAIFDCYVMSRVKVGGASTYVIYLVVPQGRWPEPLEAELRGIVPERVELLCVGVSHIPLTPSGSVDDAALATIPVLTPTVAKRVEVAVGEQGWVESCVVQIEPTECRMPRLHLFDLDPQWRRSSLTKEEPLRVLVEPQQRSTPHTEGPPALSKGGPITEPDRHFTGLQAVLVNAATKGLAKRLIFMSSAGESEVWTYAELLDRAERICGGLRRQGLEPGARVILLLEHAGAVVPAFWGCVLGGFVPLVMPLPASLELTNRAFDQICQVSERLGEPLIITRAEWHAGAEAVAAEVPRAGVRFANLEDLGSGPRDARHHSPALDDLAFLCLSSGSTGRPKSIMLTHRCVIMRGAGTNQHNDHCAEDVNLNWLPFDHIGSIVEHIRFTMLCCDVVYVGKDYILEEPLRLLDVIDRYRVTHTWGPNFIYALIHDSLGAELGSRGEGRRWDLSCVRFLTSGGEAASHNAMRGFLDRTRAFGFPATGFRPSFGMAEVSAGITFFEPSVEAPLGFVWLARAGVEDEPIEVVEADSPGAKSYARLGRPIPGCALRVVGQHDEVLPEGTTGRVQVAGATLAAGYLDDPVLTEQVFLAEGWLETEDLGFLLDGELVLTGRAKEMLIINGVNYYSRELEDIVEALEGVEVSFTAAAAVTGPASETEQLAIFFCPIDDDATNTARLIRRIRETLVRRAHANPTYIIPVETSAIPKTAIGKIQRLELARRLQSGEFETSLQAVDRLLENEHTLPDWFFERAWVTALAGRQRATDDLGPTVLFAEPSTARDAVLDALDARGVAVVTVETGDGFARTARGYSIAVDDHEQLRLCLHSITEGVAEAPDTIWLRGRESLGTRSPDSLEGVGDLITLVHAYAEVLGDRAARLIVVDAQSRALEAKDEIEPGRASVVGLLVTVAHEFPNVAPIHVDVAAEHDLGGAVVDALLCVSIEPAIAWRDGVRKVARLRRLEWPAPSASAPIERGETWLIIGGLGGVGLHLAAHLLERHQARLLIVGRSAVQADDPRLEALRERGGELRYLQADLSAPDDVQAISKALGERPLHGVVLSAATADERLLVDETPSHLDALLRPFAQGVERLDVLLGDRPTLRFVYIGSVVGVFGTFGGGAYGALHAWLEAFAHEQRRRGRAASYLASTQWQDTGSNAGKPQHDLVRTKKGMLTIAPRQGVAAVFGALGRGPSSVLIGPDPTHPVPAALSIGVARAADAPHAYVTRTEAQSSAPTHVEIRDDFGVTVTDGCVITTLDHMPIGPDGAVERDMLRSLGVGEQAGASVMPRNPVEQLLAEIWQRVLKLGVGVHDNFFEVGGDSIKAVMVMNQLQERIPGIFHPVSLFDAPTIAELAAHLERNYPQAFAALDVDRSASDVDGPATSTQAAHMRRYLATKLVGSSPRVDDTPPRNRRAIFILSSARSGSTLLRVLLAGNPQLFSPPELYLLGFSGLAERRELFSGRQAFLREGLIRAFMALDGQGLEAAEARMAELEARDVSVKAVYAALQRQIGDRILVDKTPSYAFNPEILRSTEAEFEGALFIHLRRHPAAMIHSFEEARVDLAVAIHGDEQGEVALGTRQKGELWWQVSHRNIIDFLANIPADRQHSLNFEELVRDPETVIRALCEFMGVSFHADMLDPHQDTQTRMTDGAHHFSRQAGDPKFHMHRGISSGAADRWRRAERPFRLSDDTWKIAAEFGYARPEPGEDRSLAQFAVVADPSNRHEPFPLTDIQEAYWAGRSHSFELGGRSVHSYTEIEGVGIDLPRLERAWQEMIKRHEMMRTIILPDGTQKVLESVPPYTIEVEDLRALSPSERSAHLDERRHHMSHRVLPCEKWPTFEVRASIVSSADTELRYRLHLSFDALFFDARSKYILFAEFRQLYRSPEVVLEPLSLSFRDYVLQEHAIKRSALHERARDYWHDRIDRLPAPPELPLAIHPRDLREPRFYQRNHTFPPQTWKRLEAMAARAQITPSCLLLTVFADAIRPWSKNDRFSLNLTTYRRLALHPQVNDIIGDFSSLILLAIEAVGDDDFVTRARAIQRALMIDLDHGAFSGVEVLRELGRRRGQPASALAPVVFTSVLGDEIHAPGEQPLAWLGEVVFNVTQTPQVWFDHIAFEEGGGLLCRWNIVEGLFPPGVPDAIFDAYIGFLVRLAADEEAWHVPWTQTRDQLIPPQQLEERARINDTLVSVPEGLLHSGFAAQVEARPDAVAVISADRTLDYRTLSALANQVGHRLRGAAIEPNQLVAVAMDRGWEQVVAVLGILVAGAAYLPVDPSLPAARFEEVLTRGGAKFVLTSSELQPLPSVPPSVEVICIDDPSILAQPSTPLETLQQITDLAYVIFTSGSSGAPKGVMIDHRAAWNTIVDINRRFGIGPTDRVLALSSLGFDLSVYDIFGMLAAGGALVIPRRHELREPSRWAHLVEAHHVTVWNTVPAFMNVLMDYGEGDAERVAMLGSLRLVMMSGDWIPLPLPEKVRALPGRPLTISLGGATEASIWSIIHPIEKTEPHWASIPYGRPMDNQTFHVLDDALEPCPEWVPGMLYIGGVGLALGYLGDAEGTNKSFVQHPRTGERLYRTGDLGRFVPAEDGLPHIEFLGREDNQVKIQGFRVELGEIEVALGRHANVQSAVVVARGERHADKQLVAYIVCHDEESPDLGARLRPYLEGLLPAYMVPTRYIMLDRLPLSANGKVDRKRLPLPSAKTGPRPVAARARHTDRIVEVVAEVLGQPGVTVDDDLFVLGATSIDIMRIVNQIDKRLNVLIEFDAIFTNSSVAGIVAAVDDMLGPDRQDRSTALGLGISCDLLHRYPLVGDPDERRAFAAAEHGLRQNDGPAVALPPAISDSLARIREERRSHRYFSASAIALSTLGELLACLRRFGPKSKPKYLYGSAGGLYPVQTHLYVKPGRVDGLEGGFYHHDRAAHQLVRVSSSVELDETIYNAHINRPIWRRAAFGVYLIAQMAAIVPLYREQSMHYAIIEAGLMAQMLELHALQNGLGLVQTGQVDFMRIRGEFGLDAGHVLVHALMGGAPGEVPPDRDGSEHEGLYYEQPEMIKEEF